MKNNASEIMALAISIPLTLLLVFFCFFPEYAYAAERDYSKVVIHHTASEDVSRETIDQWHKDRGWDGIGYHFVIRKDGTLEKGRDFSKIGAHAKGRNNYTGIALTGYDEFTDEQIETLTSILRQFNIVHIERHHEECPGKGLDIDYIKSRLVAPATK